MCGSRTGLQSAHSSTGACANCSTADHNETLFPLLIPEQEFMKEAEHIKGFENEVYWVTHGGTTPLE